LAALLDVLAVRIRHIHSFASDGTFSPATSYFLSSSRILKTNELVEHFKNQNQKMLFEKTIGIFEELSCLICHFFEKSGNWQKSKNRE
jgi:hypothetical protein